MPLVTTQHPDYEIQGFTLTVHTAERLDGQWNYYISLRAGNHEVGGGSSNTPYENELFARVAATAHSKEKIQYMLAQKPLDEWIRYGVAPHID